MKITNIFNNLSRHIADFPKKISSWTIKSYYLLKLEGQKFRTHLQDLEANNIKLGRYHLAKGNIRDAKFRFWLVDKLFAPGNAENLYWYSWALILNGEYAKAIYCLKDNSMDNIGLHNYLQDYTSLTTIPSLSREKYLEVTAGFYNFRYSDGVHDIMIAFLQELEPYLPQVNKLAKSEVIQSPATVLPNVLQVGVNHTLSAKLKEQFDIKLSVLDLKENAAVPDVNQRGLETDNIQKYEALLLAGDQAYHTDSAKKYDIVLIFDSISFSLNLASYFQHYKKLLTEKGKLVFMANTSTANLLIPKNNSYSYQIEFIRKQLTVAELNILNINKITLADNNTYSIMVNV